jgi:G patch domain-containing protein 1
MIRNKKPVENAVLDEQGRQRFHGAFTGGFSAGHYNTVGSEEGFKPSQFVSSRGNRASQKKQSANDFVDTEDGLLGGILSAKNVR